MSLVLISVGSLALAQADPIEQSLHVSATSEPLLTMGHVTITHGELDAYMQQLPDEDRAQAVSSVERIDQLLQNLLLKKALYEAGRENGLLEDDIEAFGAIQQVADMLAQREMSRRVESARLDDYEQQAREAFLANPEQFRPAPAYTFTHVLVSTAGRSEAEAMKRILEVHGKVREGSELDALVPDYSDDEASIERQGVYEERTLQQLDRNFARALSRLESPGDVSGPVRSAFGWHIIRLDARHEPDVPEWEKVRTEAIEIARRKHAERIREAYTSELLDSDAIEIVPGSIERFQKRHGFDPQALREAMNR